MMNRTWRRGNKMNTKYKRAVLVCLLIVLLLLLLYSIQYAGSRAVLGPFHGYGSGVELVVDPHAENTLPQETADSLEEGVVIVGRESLTISAGTKKQTWIFIIPGKTSSSIT